MVREPVADFYCIGDHSLCCVTSTSCQHVMFSDPIASDVASRARREESSAIVKSTFEHEVALRAIAASSW
jgi:hypothetical protein